MEDDENEPPKAPFRANRSVLLMLGLVFLALALPLALVIITGRSLLAGKPSLANGKIESHQVNSIPPEALKGLKNSLESSVDNHFQPLLADSGANPLPTAVIKSKDPRAMSRKLEKILTKDFETSALTDENGTNVRMLVQMPAPNLSKFLSLLTQDYGATVTPPHTDSLEFCEIIISP